MSYPLTVRSGRVAGWGLLGDRRKALEAGGQPGSAKRQKQSSSSAATLTASPIGSAHG